MLVKGSYCPICEIQGSPLPSSHCWPAERPQIEHQETSASYHPELTGVLVRRICDVNSELHLLTSLTALVTHHRLTPSQPPSTTDESETLGINSKSIKYWNNTVCKGVHFYNKMQETTEPLVQHKDSTFSQLSFFNL